MLRIVNWRFHTTTTTVSAKTFHTRPDNRPQSKLHKAVVGGHELSISERIEQNPLMDEREAAAYLNLSVPTLQTWRCRGGGPSFHRLGRLIKYSLADLDEWKASRRVAR